MLFRKNAKNETQYEPLIPPIEKPICKFSEYEAKKFFEWYMQNIPDRIAYLSQQCQLPEYTSSTSYEWKAAHLVRIWKWFLRIAGVEIDPVTGEKRFSVITEYVLRDIGMYIGEMFVNTCPHLRWDYYTKPKSDIFVNEPVILGFVDNTYVPPFYLRFEPIHMVRMKALNMLDGTQHTSDLYDLFMHWRKYTIEGTAAE